MNPEHMADMKKSGLSDETIESAASHSILPMQINKIFGWDIPITSLLAFPYPGTSFVRYKLFPPYKKKGEKRLQKYFQEPDTSPHLYSPPNFDRTADTILFTEGEKKALKAVQEGLNCIGLGGIWTFAVKDGSGNPQLIDDFDSVEWIDRQVELVPDSDFQKWPEIKHAVYRLGTMLEKRGANVSMLICPRYLNTMFTVINGPLGAHFSFPDEELKTFQEAKRPSKSIVYGSIAVISVQGLLHYHSNFIDIIIDYFLGGTSYESIRDQQAGLLFGENAVDIGLADSVMPYQKLLADLQKRP